MLQFARYLQNSGFLNVVNQIFIINKVLVRHKHTWAGVHVHSFYNVLDVLIHT
jgi:hypothetical protein